MFKSALSKAEEVYCGHVTMLPETTGARSTSNVKKQLFSSEKDANQKVCTDLCKQFQDSTDNLTEELPILCRVDSEPLTLTRKIKKMNTTTRRSKKDNVTIASKVKESKLNSKATKKTTLEKSRNIPPVGKKSSQPEKIKKNDGNVEGRKQIKTNALHSGKTKILTNLNSFHIDNNVDCGNLPIEKDIVQVKKGRKRKIGENKKNNSKCRSKKKCGIRDHLTNGFTEVNRLLNESPLPMSMSPGDDFSLYLPTPLPVGLRYV